jgi:regulator of sigma E protease
LLAGLNKPTGEIVELTILPKVTAFPEMGWKLEVAPKMIEIQAESFGEAVKLGTVCSLDLIKQMYVTLKRLVTGEVGAKNLGGIIRISQVSYQAAQRGPSWFWYFLALLSVNLAFVNVLPIPVLDGGHLMFLLIEKVKGSPVSTKVFGYSQVIGLVFVLLLVLFVTYNDILRLL